MEKDERFTYDCEECGEQDVENYDTKTDRYLCDKCFALVSGDVE